jgi:hypothetical protein
VRVRLVICLRHPEEVGKVWSDSFVANQPIFDDVSKEVLRWNLLPFALSKWWLYVYSSYFLAPLNSLSISGCGMLTFTGCDLLVYVGIHVSCAVMTINANPVEPIKVEFSLIFTCDHNFGRDLLRNSI